MFSDYKHVHFVGIGGIGMSALAKWFLSEGVAVSGSDVHLSSITHDLEKRGVKIYSGHVLSNVSNDVDLLIHTSAVADDNPERQVAIDRGIRDCTNFEFLGEVSKQFSTIVVSGTNGKSTTTAMLGLILSAAGNDPTVLVGSFVPDFKDGNIRIGKSRFFVVEGCEYRANMLNLEPEMIVLTNLEEDHLDYYRDLSHIQATFQRLIDKLPEKGSVVYNASDKGISALSIKNGSGFAIDPSVGVKAKYTGKERTIGKGIQTMSVYRADERIGIITLKIPGVFNMMNALCAVSSAMELGVSFAICEHVLSNFKGIWRRFELMGVWRGADIISDYGHHPTAIRQTIVAAREFFPNRRIILCYQPHQHDRTKKLFDDFVPALMLADHIILNEVYDVAGRNEGHDVSSKDLANAIRKVDSAKDVRYAQDEHDVENELRDLIKPDDVVIIMGAGDIDDVARNICL